MKLTVVLCSSLSHNQDPTSFAQLSLISNQEYDNQTIPDAFQQNWYNSDLNELHFCMSKSLVYYAIRFQEQ